MKRTDAREFLMQLFYQMEAQNDFSNASQERFMSSYASDAKEDDYTHRVIIAFIANKEKIDKTIEEASEKWNFSRIAKVDLAILRLAVTEIKFLKDADVPTQVAINEAVNLAKKFGSDESQKFVNGLLGKIAK